MLPVPFDSSMRRTNRPSLRAVYTHHSLRQCLVVIGKTNRGGLSPMVRFSVPPRGYTRLRTDLVASRGAGNEESRRESEANNEEGESDRSQVALENQYTVFDVSLGYAGQGEQVNQQARTALCRFFFGNHFPPGQSGQCFAQTSLIMQLYFRVRWVGWLLAQAGLSGSHAGASLQASRELFVNTPTLWISCCNCACKLPRLHTTLLKNTLRPQGPTHV